MKKKGLILSIAMLLVIGFFGVNQWERIKDASLIQKCTFQGSTDTYELSPEQSGNAVTIAAIAIRRGLPKRAITVALATVMQESKLRVLNYGDRDSVGLFQQRPSQGWGDESSLMDPVYSSSKFFSALMKVPDWQQLSIADAAQAVQRSADGRAYAAWEPEARVMSEILSTEPYAFTCYLHRYPTISSPTSDRAAKLVTDLEEVFGASIQVQQEGRLLTVDVKASKSGLIAAWLVTHADQYGIATLDADQHSWSRGEWKKNSAHLDQVKARLL